MNMDFNGAEIVERIDCCLDKMNEKRQVMCEYAGIKSAQTITDLAKKNSMPAADKMLKISEFLGVSFVWLMKGKNTEGTNFSFEALEIARIIDSLTDEGKKSALAAVEGIQKHYKKEKEEYPRISKEDELSSIDQEEEYTPLDWDYYNIPYVGEVAAGHPIDVNAEYETTFPIYKKYLKGDVNNYFLVKTVGTSMIHSGIENGQYALIRHEIEPVDGKIMLVLHNNESTLKRLKKVNNLWWLCWEDGSYNRLVVDSDGFEVQGRLIAPIRIKAI